VKLRYKKTPETFTMQTSLPPTLASQLPACFAATLSRLLATTAAFWQACDTVAEI
jgi:hypothetical protein